jgi:hypothetical protein
VPFTQSTLDLLLAGQAAEFRRRCGDALISSVTYGRQAFVTVQLYSLSYSNDVLRNQTTNLRAEVSAWASLGYSATTQSQIVQKYSTYQARVAVLSYGSSVPVATVVDLNTAMQYIQAFDSESPSTEAAIDFQAVDYTVPANLAGLYPDYKPYRRTLNTWYQFDQQLAQRCQIFDEGIFPNTARTMSQEAQSYGGAGLSLRDACFYMKEAVLENISRCEDTSLWSVCIRPDAGTCAVRTGSGTMAGCLPYAQQFPFLSSTATNIHLVADLNSGFSSDSKSTSAQQCFPNAVILDRRVPFSCINGACPNPLNGIAVVDNASIHVTGNGTDWNPATRCLSGWATISRPSLYKAGAHIDQIQTANALSPQWPTYLLP